MSRLVHWFVPFLSLCMLRKRYTFPALLKCKAGASIRVLDTGGLLTLRVRLAPTLWYARATQREELVVLRLRHDRRELGGRERIGQSGTRRFLHVRRNRDRRFRDVVAVITLGEQVAEAVRVARPRRVAIAAHKGRIHSHPEDVIPREYRCRRFVEHEELAVEDAVVGIRPPGVDPLKAGRRPGTAAVVGALPSRRAAGRRRHVHHAEAALRRLHDRAG